MNIEDFIRKDEQLSKNMRIDEGKRILHAILVFLAHSGDSWFWLLGIVIIWLIGNSEWKSRSVLMAFSLFILAVIVVLLKFAIKRPRPEGKWGKIYRSADPHSFPSGHAARTAALAVMAISTGPLWFAIIIGLWAPLVGFSRISLGVHYISDVLIGSLIGIFISICTVLFFRVVSPFLPAFLFS